MKQVISYRLLLALLCLVTACTTHADEKHLLVMDRIHEAGNFYRIKLVANGGEASSSSLNGQKVGSENKNLSATAVMVIEVLSLHEDDEVKSAAIKLESFEGEYNGKPVEIDTTKRLIMNGKADGNTYAYENGDKIEGEGPVALLNLMSNYIVDDGEEQGDKPDEQKIFNLEDPKAVGESWECDNKLMAADLAEEGVVADPEKMESEMNFLAVETYNGMKCAKLAVAVDFGPIDLPALTNQGFSIDKSEMKLAVKGLLPLDTEVVGGTFEIEMSMNMTASSKIEQGNLRVDVENSHALKIHHLPLEE